jgi:hypothetical protein
MTYEANCKLQSGCREFSGIKDAAGRVIDAEATRNGCCPAVALALK